MSRRESDPLSPEWRAAIREVATALRKEIGREIDRAGADRAGRMLSALLWPRGPGRPPSAEVSKAISMRRTGTEWATVYEAVIDDFHALPRHEQRYRADKLRLAVKARLRKLRRRQKPSS